MNEKGFRFKDYTENACIERKSYSPDTKAFQLCDLNSSSRSEIPNFSPMILL